MTRHLRSLHDLEGAELTRIVDLAAELKKDRGAHADALRGKSIAMIFSKPSTRTRVSFEVGIHQLGGNPLFLAASGSTGMQLTRGETPHDTAKVLSRYVDGIVMRTFAQRDVDDLAKHSDVPVINALTDSYHPCQALADVLTIKEHLGDARGKKLVYVGAGNNVTASLMLAGPRAGMDVVCACPERLPPPEKTLKRAQADAEAAGTSVTVEADIMKAVSGAHVLYTDAWVSMGQEDEADELRQQLESFRVSGKVMAAADPKAIFMHCLPAHRGDEVTDEVIDGPQSVVFDQAENRLHTQKALLLLLLECVAW